MMGRISDSRKSGYEQRGSLSAANTLLLLGPIAVLLIAFFFAPIFWFLAQSITQPDWTLQHYARFVERPLYLRIMGRTALTAVEVTLLTLLLGYPIALLMARLKGWRALLVGACVVVPLSASVLVRSYAWVVLLRRTGVVNSVLQSLELIETPLPLLYSQGAVLVAMTHVLLPFMIIPLFTVLKTIPADLTQAALGLGASHTRVFTSIILPLSIPGIVAGALMVFVLALGFYITPALVGGSNTLLISTLIAQQVMTFLNFPFAGAIALLLLILSVGVTILLRRALGQAEVIFNG